MVCFLGGSKLSLLLAPSEFEMAGGGGYAAPCLAGVGDEGVALSLVSTPCPQGLFVCLFVLFLHGGRA